jgi:hypothetical protein
MRKKEKVSGLDLDDFAPAGQRRARHEPSVSRWKKMMWSESAIVKPVLGGNTRCGELGIDIDAPSRRMADNT